MLKRLRPYFRYLRPVRWQFFGALFAGLVYGLASGAGFPFLLREVLPMVLVGEGEVVPWDSLIFVALALPAELQTARSKETGKQLLRGCPELSLCDTNLDVNPF